MFHSPRSLSLVILGLQMQIAGLALILFILSRNLQKEHRARLLLEQARIELRHE